ncbi:MAG: tryptophan synthase subunit alpha [Elusimicrobia bacterium]|nr:tryptophan synthase subunit alpha [Elusimicrobiota bacterium]
MTRIENLLKKLKKQNKKALSIFLTAGYPNIKTTEKLIGRIEKYVDLIELGVPFSDPIADGPTIQYSSQEALKKNINISNIFSIVKNIRKTTKVPIVIMGYLNPIYNFGLKKFFSEAKKTGVDGIIIPDLSYEESRQIRDLSKISKIAYIPLVALTTGKERAIRIAKSSTGFVYVTAVTGVTGARNKISGELIPFLKKLRTKTTKSLLVGFGISNSGHIENLRKYCDGFIVGSAIIDLIRRKKSVEKFVKRLSFNTEK